jgi:hypothetical protein
LGFFACRNSILRLSLSLCSALRRPREELKVNAVEEKKSPAPDQFLKGPCLFATALFLFRQFTAGASGLFKILGGNCSGFVAESFCSLRLRISGFKL